MIVLVCGGREYADRKRLFRVLDKLHDKAPITLLVQGGARGADSLAGEWAASKAVPCLRHPADWDKYGKAAGARRNQAMLHQWGPEMVVAFPGGVGTDDMVARANRAEIRVRRVRNREEQA